MPTSTQLKNQIDAALNNSVADDSITPAIEATQIKAVVDYVDQQVLQKVVKVSLTSSQILNIFTTPKELVPAIAGKLLKMKFIHQKYTHLTTPYTGGAVWKIGLGTISNAFSVVSAVIGSADNSQSLQDFSQNLSASGQSYEGLSIVIGATSANPTGGDGTMDIYLTYDEITIS